MTVRSTIKDSFTPCVKEGKLLQVCDDDSFIIKGIHQKKHHQRIHQKLIKTSSKKLQRLIKTSSKNSTKHHQRIHQRLIKKRIKEFIKTSSKNSSKTHQKKNQRIHQRKHRPFRCFQNNFFLFFSLSRH